MAVITLKSYFKISMCVLISLKINKALYNFSGNFKLCSASTMYVICEFHLVQDTLDCLNEKL
jgi:hypothetical protein